MFAHIPHDIFNTQINGNIKEALKILDANVGDVKSKSRTFVWEFASLDPENPVTQVSKTPSDEDYQCDLMEAELYQKRERELTEYSGSTPRTPSDIRGLDLEGELAAEREELTRLDSENDKAIPNGGENDILRPETILERNENEDSNLESLQEREETEDPKPRRWMKPKRSINVVKTELLIKDVAKFIEEMKKRMLQEDLEVRVIPCPSSCRFSLPIDMTRLEGLSPLEYVAQFCHVTDTRKKVYTEKYESYMEERDPKSLFVSEIQELYEKLYQEPTLADEMLHLRRLLNLNMNMELEIEIFTIVSCVMERVIVKGKGLRSPDENKKDLLEVANFSSLNGKLHGINISPPLHALLDFIRNT